MHRTLGISDVAEPDGLTMNRRTRSTANGTIAMLGPAEERYTSTWFGSPTAGGVEAELRSYSVSGFDGLSELQSLRNTLARRV